MNVTRFKYFFFKSIGAVMLLVGIVIYIVTKSIIPVIIAIVALGLILFGGYYKEKNLEDNSNIEMGHYNTLISLYKYTGGIIALLIGIAAWIIGGNINDIKDNATKEIDSFKGELKAIKIESKEAIIQSQLAADKQIEYIRNNMKLFLDITKDITSIQIETIREDARNLALSSARARIEEVFKSTNLQKEIDSAARKEFGEKLEEIVKSEMQRSTKLFEDFPTISGLSDRLSFSMILSEEDRTALDQLDSISQFANNPTLRKVAEKTILAKGIEFEKAINTELRTAYQRSIYEPDSIFSEADSVRIKKQLIDLIYTEKNIWKVAYTFVVLRNFSGIALNNFDFKEVRRMKENLNIIENKP